MFSDQINQEAIRLWERQFPKDADVWMPAVYPMLREGSILFVGLNPSFSDRGFSTFLADSPYANLKPREFYHWRNRTVFDLPTAIGIEKLAKERYAFFAKFKEIANKLNAHWEHVDLFFYRQTEQKKFIELVESKEKPNKFADSQLELSTMLITSAEPKIIVVANAYAAKIFHERFDARFDEKSGYHRIQSHGRAIPVFLTSMLTGQRALDRFSYQRLRWHIEHVYQTEC